jgi:hypothetical protein
LAQSSQISETVKHTKAISQFMMSDEYIKMAEGFIKWHQSFNSGLIPSERVILGSREEIEEQVLRWADYTEQNLEDLDLEIFVQTIESLI